MRPSPTDVGAIMGDLPEEDEKIARPLDRLCLQSAAERVATQWDNATGDAVDITEVQQVLASMVSAIEDPAATIPPDARTVLGRYLIQLLRREVLEQWNSRSAPSQDAATVLATVSAIDRVETAIQPGWSEFFANRLSSPDGLDLVVEVAHDLRSPLTSILFLAETLQRGQSGDINDLQRRQLGLIYAAGLGLSSLASNVIELARGGDRLVDDDPSPLSITEILESVRDIVRPIAEEKGLSIRIQPPVSDQRLGNPIALSRVLLNLVTNALKFTDEGYVDLSARPTDMNHIEFSVRDTGHGIKGPALATLYQPFRRAVGRDGYRFSGTGLGLAISRKLVEAMNTTLQVETEGGAGTRFFFVLSMPPAPNT